MTPQHLLVFCIVALTAITPSTSEIDCIIEDFEEGSLGSFSERCSLPITNAFDVKVYNASFEPPAGSDGFYAAANGFSCMRYNKKITVTDGFKLTFNMFKLSKSENGGWCYAIALEDSDEPTMMDNMIFYVTGDGGWKIEEVKFDKLEDGKNIRLEIVCEDLGLKGSFLAIDYIEIGSSNPEDCIQTTTTTLSTTTLTTPNTPEPDTTESTTNTETTEDLTTSETTEPTTLTESTISTTTTDPEITTEDSETTSDDSTGGTSPDTTTLPSGPKPPNNSDEQSQRLMSIIGVCIGSALTIWLIVLTISSINISTIPVVNRAGIKDDVGMTIPRLQVQQIKTDDVGKWVIDISGADSKKE